jgi:NurA-like 5'-3' nuclease
MIMSAEEFVRLRLSDDPEEYGRSASDSANELVWLDVIDRYPDMRSWVAHNKTVPLSVLRILSKDSDSDVRITVASKRKLDESLFETLAADIDESVRQRIAYNKKTPMRVLKLLSEDKEPIVRDVALNRLEGI